MKPEVDKKKRKKNTTPHPYKKTGKKEKDKENRRVEYEARAAIWKSYPPETQLTMLDARCAVAERQRARILTAAGAIAWDSDRRVLVYAIREREGSEEREKGSGRNK